LFLDLQNILSFLPNHFFYPSLHLQLILQYIDMIIQEFLLLKHWC